MIRKLEQTYVGLYISRRTTYPLTSVYCLLVSTAIGRASIFEYPWHAVNIFTCILLRVHNSCTRTKAARFVWVPHKNTNAIVNLVMSCTVCTYGTAQFKLEARVRVTRVCFVARLEYFSKSCVSVDNCTRISRAIHARVTSPYMHACG